MHDKFNCNIRKTEIKETRFEEIPVNIIKRFFQVKLESHVALFPFGSFHKMYDFVKYIA